MITINVGGTLFTTHESTLSRYENSLLAVALRTESFAKDEQGRLFFDRDPILFAKLLNILRHTSYRVTLEIYKEAEYFGLPFEQNIFAIDTAEGEVYLSPKDYSLFSQKMSLDSLGPNGHGFFPCTKQQLKDWTKFRHAIVNLDSYLFWKDHGTIELPEEFILLVNGQCLYNTESKDLFRCPRQSSTLCLCEIQFN